MPQAVATIASAAHSAARAMLRFSGIDARESDYCAERAIGIFSRAKHREKRMGGVFRLRPLRDSPAASYSPVTPSVTVPSALKGLTAVFGMGTGVSPSPWRPETCRTHG